MLQQHACSFQCPRPALAPEGLLPAPGRLFCEYRSGMVQPASSLRSVKRKGGREDRNQGDGGTSRGAKPTCSCWHPPSGARCGMNIISSVGIGNQCASYQSILTLSSGSSGCPYPDPPANTSLLPTRSLREELWLIALLFPRPHLLLPVALGGKTRCFLLLPPSPDHRQVKQAKYVSAVNRGD